MQSSAPDPYKTSAAQGAANRESAVAGSIVNNMNESSPYGNVAYTKIGDEEITDSSGNKVKVPRYQRTTTLSQGQQQLYNQQVQMGQTMNSLAGSQLSRLGSLLGRPVDTSTLPKVGKDYEAGRSAVEQALYSRLNPQMERDEEAARSRMAASGLAQGSEAYGQEMDRMGRLRNDARNQVVLAGGQEQSRLAGLDMAAREQALAELFAVRNQPLNEISALLSGGQVNMPQFAQAYRQGVQAAPVSENVYRSSEINRQNNSNFMGGLFGLGSSLIGGGMRMSDRRAKKNIRRVGRTEGGLPVYTFRYKSGGPVLLGVMADEVEKVNPAAVGRIGRMKAVDYGMVI